MIRGGLALTAVLAFAAVSEAEALAADPPVDIEEHPPATKRRNQQLFEAGLALTITGGVAINVGIFLAAGGINTRAYDSAKCISNCDPSKGESLIVGGLTTLGIGVLAAAAGVVMILVGGKRVPVGLTPPPTQPNPEKVAPPGESPLAPAPGDKVLLWIPNVAVLPGSVAMGWAF